MKLIYHKGNNQISPFDSELVTMAQGQNLLLVSPYISLPYLRRLINISKSWRLLTDFQEWIISHPKKNQRLEICEFINENFDKIKHIEEIHAKVLVSDNSAFIGSANFTNTGILLKTEMSVSFSEKDKVEELKRWFQSLWNVSSEFKKKQLLDFVNQNENVNPQLKIIGLKNSLANQRRKSTLVPIDKSLKTEKDYKEELVNAIKKLNQNKRWLNRYFDLVKEILSEFNIDEISSKINMSVRLDLKMPITIGQRYIICPQFRGDAIGFILPLEFEDIVNDYPKAKIHEYFRGKKNKPEANWIDFESNIIFSKDKVLFDSWKNSIRKELERTNTSGFRKYHNPLYYKVVMDKKFRKTILG